MYIPRIIITAIVFAILAVPAFADNNKTTICHNGETITVSNSALSAHLNNHGDYKGECILPEYEKPAPKLNLVLIMRCKNNNGLIEVSGVSFSGASIALEPGVLPEVSDNCAVEVAQTMDAGFKLRNVVGVLDETEYLFIMKY